MVTRAVQTGGTFAALDKRDNSPLFPKADNDPSLATYVWGINSLILPANATDLVQIRGSATRKTVIRQVYVSGRCQTAPQNILLQMVRRSAASSGGAAGSWANMSLDDVAAAAGITVFNNVVAGAGPVIGGNGGIVAVGSVNVAPASNGSIDRWQLDKTWKNEKGIELRDAGDFVSLFIPGGNLNVANQPLFDIEIIITEERI